MRYLSLSEALRLHADLVRRPVERRETFGGEELYPALADKAAALGFALVQGHAFLDGNKRIGHAAMEVFLMLNGHELVESVDEQERAILAVASDKMSREAFTQWVTQRVRAVD